MIRYIFLGCLILISSCAQNLPLREPAAVGLNGGSRCRLDFQCKSLNCNSGYCDTFKGANCRPIGLSCSSDRDCCSDSCINGRCIGSSQQCARVEQFCTSDQECCSNQCSRETLRCVGSKRDCAFVAQKCGSSSECCSGYCSREYNMCLGSPRDFAQFDEICNSDSQCASNFCTREKYTCGN